MPKLVSLFMLALGALTAVNAKNVTFIYDCPTLTPRSTATKVSDLRIDDIKVVGFLGDSYAAAFSAMGYKATQLDALSNCSSSSSSSDNNAIGATLNLSPSKEYRGISYGIGGDEYAFTVPNYMKHYNKNVTGYSLGSHSSEICGADFCDSSYQTVYDQLNAAQSGALAMNLEHMLEYLIPEMKSMDNVDLENDWKMISIQIGDNVPKAVVNLIGSFNTSQIIPLSDEYGIGYCQMTGTNVSTITNRQLCSCAATEDGRRTVSEHFSAYNEKLQAPYKKYQQNQTNDFAVIYQQGNINYSSAPMQYFNDDDCLHPSSFGHQWLSRFVWSQLFLSYDSKPSVINYEDNLSIYCPTDEDRIRID
ncbi:MAG: hypothetical protein EXX96DRAFT_630936 [Benjaminiella poitrasii]|nr:MAG: hypothetical protein EXX96DRAFT_630936 [Benjaminiella poitrasii]